MALAITASFRKLLQRAEVATNAKVNQMLDIAFALSGTVDTAELTAGAVTPAKASGGAWFWGTDAGTANAHVVTTAQTLAALTTGSIVAYMVNAGPNTGAVTVNPSALGVKTIKHANGQDLQPGFVRAGQVLSLRYDGTNFVMLSIGSNASDRYLVSTGSANAYVLTFGGSTGWPTVTALTNGLRLAFKANFTNTGASTLAVDGLAPPAIRKQDNQPLTSGDILTDMVVEVVYDSTLGVFLMSSPVSPTSSSSNVASRMYNWQNFR